MYTGSAAEYSHVQDYLAYKEYIYIYINTYYVYIHTHKIT